MKCCDESKKKPNNTTSGIRVTKIEYDNNRYDLDESNQVIQSKSLWHCIINKITSINLKK